MGKRILYVTTVGETMYFFERLVEKLVKDGHVVDIACNNSADDVTPIYKKLGCKIYNIPCSRSPLNSGNIKAVKELKRIVRENDYEIVHCHTPIAAAITRLACKKLRKTGVKVYYTAHGFHFYKGAPFKNWLMYYPVEKICARYTDVLITINGQDYELAKKKMKAKKVIYVPGVGLDVEKFNGTSCDISKKRHELGIPEEAYLILSVGELNDNKNHESVIKAISKLDCVDTKNIHYAIAGLGDNYDYLTESARKNGLSDRFHLLGYRDDVAELFKCSDLFIHPSYREGLPVAVMEAMASGIAVTCSNIRGCQDLVDEKYLFDPCDVISISKAIMEMIDSDNDVIIDANYKKIKQFDISNIITRMYELYGMQ